MGHKSRWEREFNFDPRNLPRKENFTEKLQKQGTRGRIFWIVTLSLWAAAIIMVVLIALLYSGPFSIGFAVLCIILSFPLLLLFVGEFFYPYEYWQFFHQFRWDIRGGEPTTFALVAHQIGGVFGAVLVISLVALLPMTVY